MKLTKYEHACLVVEQDGKSLVIDPGEFTTDFVVPENVVAIVITHEHQDHLSKAHVDTIVSQNPNVVIIGHADVTEKLSDYKTQSVVANEGIKVEPFELEFFGGTHATIHQDIPLIANLGVMVNGKLYYPGDSYTLPNQAVEVLALPVAAPWMKLSEAVDFVRDVKPKFAFPTHDAVLSDVGKGLPDRLIPLLTDGLDVHYERLKKPIDI